MLNKSKQDNKEVRTVFVPAPARKLTSNDYSFILNLISKIIDMLIIWTLLIK